MRLVDSGISSGTDLFTWEEVKAYLRIRVDNDQTEIMEQMRASVDQIEKRTNRILVQRSFSVYFNEKETGPDTLTSPVNYRVRTCRPGEMVLPVLPVDLAASTLVCEYHSGVSAGVQTWTAFTDFYVTEDTPHRFRFTEDVTLPTTYNDEGDWRLTGLVAGYDDDSAPEALKVAVLTQLDAHYNGMVDAERLIENLVGPLKVHGNSF